MTTATLALTELEGHAELKSLMVEAHLPLLFRSPVHSIFGCAAPWTSASISIDFPLPQGGRQ